jgi:chromate transporter
MAVYLGNLRAGTVGGLLAGMLFVLPSFVIVLGLSALYVGAGGAGALGRSAIVFPGMQAGALVVIYLSAWTMGRPYLRGGSRARAIAVATLSAALVAVAPRYEPLVILGVGLLGVALSRRNGKGSRGGEGEGNRDGKAPSSASSSRPRALAWPLAAGLFATGGGAAVLGDLFWTCFKAGAFVFGSGLAIVPLLEADAVGHFGWLTHAEFMDGIALGQITPGPIVITATFIGYKVAGVLGALTATVGMFLPPFLNVLLLVPRTFERWSHRAEMKAFSEWAIPSVIGAILGTTLRLSWFTLQGWIPCAVFVGAAIVALRFRPPSWVLIPGAGGVALALRLLGG